MTPELLNSYITKIIKILEHEPEKHKEWESPFENDHLITPAITTAILYQIRHITTNIPEENKIKLFSYITESDVRLIYRIFAILVGHLNPGVSLKTLDNMNNHLITVFPEYKYGHISANTLGYRKYSVDEADIAEDGHQLPVIIDNLFLMIKEELPPFERKVYEEGRKFVQVMMDKPNKLIRVRVIISTRVELFNFMNNLSNRIINEWDNHLRDKYSRRFTII